MTYDELVRSAVVSNGCATINIPQHYRYVLTGDGWGRRGSCYTTCFVIDVVNKEIVDWVKVPFDSTEYVSMARPRSMCKARRDFYTFLDEGKTALFASLQVGVDYDHHNLEHHTIEFIENAIADSTRTRILMYRYNQLDDVLVTPEPKKTKVVRQDGANL